MKSPYRCPECSQEFQDKGRYFPFCSERCKLLDLGAWASERYKIASRVSDESEDANSEQEMANKSSKEEN